MTSGTRRRTAALTCDIDHATRVIRSRYHRQPDFAEWRAIMERVLAEVAFRPLNLLSDRRALLEAAAPAVIRQMAAFVVANRDVFEGGRWAVVVAPAHRAEYGMARMGSVLIERAGVLLRPFTDYDAARQWVEGVEMDDVT